MLWSYATLADDTSIAYSATRQDGTVRIVAERPIDYGFDHAECALPACRWQDVYGFTTENIAQLTDFIKNNAPLNFDMADEKAMALKDVA